MCLLLLGFCEQTQSELHLSQRLLVFQTALETMLSKYHATIEITENVEPSSARQIKPPQGKINAFKADVTYLI